MSAVPGNDSTRTKRPFWMHQLVEYVLGIVLIAQGLQSPTPAIPAVAGGLVVVNTAIARGPLSAFRVFTRAQHRITDLVVMAVVFVLALQPAVEVDASVRVVMVVIAAVMAFVWFQSNFTEKAKRGDRAAISAADGRGTEIGRLAGRAVGDGINAAKRMRDARKR